MDWPSKSAVAAGISGGLVNIAVVLGLYARGAYPTLESLSGIGVLTIAAFILGFVAILITVHTRLLSPAVGFLVVLVGTVSVELTTPSPEWGELNGHIIVTGPTHISSYANTWYIWLALLLYVAVVEVGIRQGYGVRDHHLRHLPTIPASWSTIGWVVAGAAGFLGIATTLLVVRSGLQSVAVALIIFVLTTAVAAIPLVALLTNGILLPTVLFAVFVPPMLSIEVFVTTDSPVHILLFGPSALVLVLAWGVEAMIRARLSGRDGGRLTESTSK